MKKFLGLSMVVFLCFIFIFSFSWKFKYINKDLEVITKVEGKDIIIKDSILKINGINISSTIPGSFPGDFKANKEDYTRWFYFIKDLNINCLRVQGLMNPDFYRALYEFNLNNEPFYLLQGIDINESLLDEGEDIQGETMLKEVKEEIELVVDSIHGRTKRGILKEKNEDFNVDVSKYVIAYSIGDELAYDDIIYSEIMNDLSDFEGKYIKSNDNSSDTEKYLSYLGDYLINYETEKYRVQRAITFISVEEDIMKFLNEGYVNKENKEKRFLDIRNIEKTDLFKAGIFASYNMSILKGNKYLNQDSFSKYLDTLNKNHDIPVVISEYSIPSARMAGDYIYEDDKGYITEEEQGEFLVLAKKAINKSNISGSILFEWQDSWYRSSWNTNKLFEQGKSAYWSNAQVFSQNFGLMTFEPGYEKENSYPDESISEWKDEDLINENENIKLYVKQNEKYLQFLIKLKNPLDKDERIYIDLDVTPNSGVNYYDKKDLKFNDDIDFIVDLGRKGGQILVHEYYDTFKFIESIKELKINPNNISVKKNGGIFSVVRLHAKEKIYSEVTKEFKEAKSYETGNLVLGNGNPNSEDFNSASDYYIGEDYIELRLPWGLLNFKDPSTKSIIDDFYENFSFDSKKIDNIKIGVTHENKTNKLRLDSKEFKLSTWSKPKYHERLKKSYYILKEEANKNEG